MDINTLSIQLYSGKEETNKLQKTQQQAIFSKNQNTFFQFPKKVRGDLPPPPSLVTLLQQVAN